MMPPDALQGWAPSFGQWCSFAISSLRWTGSTYPFRAHVESIQSVAVRLELLDRLTGEFGGREDPDVVFFSGPENGIHPRPPRAVAEDVVVQDQGPHIRGSQDPKQMGQGPFRMLCGIMVRHVGHRTVHVEDGRLRVDQEGKVLLQWRAEYVRGVDEHFVPLSDSRHDDIAEFIIVAVRQSRRKQEFRPTEIHLISIGDLDFLRILLQRPDERARALPLASIDVELPILQVRELAAEDGWRIRVVVIVVVMGDRQDVRAFRGASDPLPQLLLAVLLRWMRPKVVPVGTEAHARVDEDGHVRRLDECSHRPRPEAVGGQRRELHRDSAPPPTCRLPLWNPSVGNRDREATLSTYAWRVGRFPSPWSSRTTAATTDRASPFRRYPSRTWTMPMTPTRSVIVWVKAHAIGSPPS